MMMIHDIGLQFHILLRNGKTDMNCSIPIHKHIRFCNQMSIRKIDLIMLFMKRNFFLLNGSRVFFLIDESTFYNFQGDLQSYQGFCEFPSIFCVCCSTVRSLTMVFCVHWLIVKIHRVFTDIMYFMVTTHCH